MRPTPRTLVLAVAGGVPLAALPAITGRDELWLVWAGFVGVLVALLGVEFALLPVARSVAFELRGPTMHEFGAPVPLRVQGRAGRAVDCDVELEVDGDCPAPAPLRMPIPAGGEAEARVPLEPTRRGQLHLVALHVRWRGPLGLLWNERRVPIDRRVRVVVDVSSVRARVSRMVENRDLQHGLKIERYIGDGTEFESLREFVVGMDHRAIDWKASARHRALLVREHRAERAQSMMLCVDAGRLMAEPLRRVPRLDHAIQAALELAFVSLRAGDRVGVYSFADRPHQPLLPSAGVHTMHAVQEQLAALDYSDRESNFTLAMTQLLQQLRRRTLLVLFTDFVDSVTAELMLRNVAWLARRHLLLFVALRDPLVHELGTREPDSVEDVYRAVVADGFVRERRVVLQRLRQLGANVLDCDARELGPALIDRYLTLKRRELL